MSTVYDYPLVDWIRWSLHHDSLDSVVASIRRDVPLESRLMESERGSNRAYLEKILREETLKQFGHALRPLVEAALNGVDAKTSGHQGEYRLTLRAKRKLFSSRDEGAGMSLEEVLLFLNIPFNTNKTGDETIGQFGVGAFSLFQYCLALPMKSRVEVATRKGDEELNAAFYATGPSVGELRMRLEYEKKILSKYGLSFSGNGTQVTVRHRLQHSRTEITNYLISQLHSIPSYKAVIEINGTAINEERNALWVTVPVALASERGTLHQEVGLKMPKMREKDVPILEQHYRSSQIFLTSQGVPVQTREGTLPFRVEVAFPPAVKVVEGRDEFKQDNNYEKSAQTVFEALLNYIQIHPSITNGTIVAELIATIAPLISIEKASKIATIERIKKEAFRDREYILDEATIAEFVPFFGTEIFQSNVVPCQTIKTRLFLEDVLKKRDTFLDEVPRVIATYTQPELAAAIHDDGTYYPNLRLLVRETVAHSLQRVHLVEVDPLGEKAVLVVGRKSIQNKELYVNIAHPLVSGPFHPLKAYGIVADYYSLLDARVEAQIESKKHNLLITSLGEAAEDVVYRSLERLLPITRTTTEEIIKMEETK